MPQHPQLTGSGRGSATEPTREVRALLLAQMELERALARHAGLRLLELRAMTHLTAGDGPLGPVELAGRLGISTGSGTELADRLERAGHLHRRRAADDRRRVVLEPDEASTARLRRTLAPLIAELDEMAGTFTGAEQAAIIRYLAGATGCVASFAATLGGDG